MRVSQSDIDNVIRNVSIVDVIGEYVQLEKKGKNFIGLCPFHNDNNPSMSVSEDKKIFKCFSCGAGGNAITFIQDYEKIPFLEALKKVSEKAGIQLDITTKDDGKSKYYRINKYVYEMYSFYLFNSTSGKEALSYLNKRKLSNEIIRKFKLGMSFDTDSVHKTLSAKKIESLDMLNLGLVSKNDNRYYDYFKKRIIFSIADINGNILGFSGRALGDVKPKYINSRESLVFAKSRILYNANNAMLPARRNKRVILFEGFMDVIQASIAGVEEGVAVMGTALTKQHIYTLKKISKNVVICFDGDEPGIEAAKSAYDILKADFNVSVVILPDKLDPDDYINKHSAEKFKIELDNALNEIDFIFTYYLRKIDLKNVNHIEEFKKIIFAMIKDRSNTEREIYFSRLSQELNVSIDALRNDFVYKPSVKVKKETQKSTKYLTAEKDLIALMLQSKRNVINHHTKVDDIYVDARNNEIRTVIERYYKVNAEYNQDKFLEFLPTRLHDYFLNNFRTSRFYNGEEIKDILKALKEFSLLEQKKNLEAALVKASDEEKAELVSRILDIQKKIKRRGESFE